MDVGLLILRIVLGFILFVHGMQKATGWFSGPGLTAAETLFSKIGQEPARIKVRLAVLCELGAAFLLVAGLATPLAVALATSTMVVAAMALTMASGSFWIAAGGGEYPAMLGAISAVLGFTGPGKYSLDSVLAVYSLLSVNTVAIGVAVLITALIGAAPSVLSTRKTLAGNQ